MGNIMVTSGRLKELAEQLRMLNGKWMNSAENLNGTEAALKGMWEGEANEAFHAAFIRDYSQFENFHTAVEQYAAVLITIAEKYQQAETANMQIASARSY